MLASYDEMGVSRSEIAIETDTYFSDMSSRKFISRTARPRRR